MSELITATLTTDQPATTELPLPIGHTVGTMQLTATDGDGAALGNAAISIDATLDPNTQIATLAAQTVALGDGLTAYVDAAGNIFRLGVSQCPGPVVVTATLQDGYTNTAIPLTGGGSGTPGGRHH